MNLELSRTVEKLSFYLQTNKLAGPRFMNAGRRHETPGSEAKEFITHKTTGTTSFIFGSGSPCPSSPPEAKDASLAGCCTCRGFVSQLRDPKLRKPPSFMMSCKQTCPAFVPEVDLIFILLDSERIGRPLWWETLALSFKAVCCSNITEKITQNKKLPVPLLTRDPWITISQQE